ncbi:MAG: DUF3179 domain-containing protein [Chloroflexota bacterium]
MNGFGSSAGRTAGRAASGRRALLLSLGTVAAAAGVVGVAGVAGVAARGGALGRAAPGAPAARPQSGEENDRLRVSPSGWKTDFSKRTVPLGEIMSGGPGKDGIPPIDAPKFVDVPAAAAWLKDVEPVIALELNGAARAYPLQILIWHEIANDTLGGVPVVVTFCPLCNTALVFDRRLDGTHHDFGVSGNLRHSDLLMWDRQTESWWQQATGQAIVGELAGKRLTMIPAQIVSWQDFRTTWPRGDVLSRETGHSCAYGRNPYVGYDEVGKAPFLYRGPTDGRLPPMERVLLVEIGERQVAYPFSRLAERRVVNDALDGTPLVALWSRGTASALDRADIATSRDVGAAAAFSPMVDDARLTFSAAGDGRFRDAETRSTWSITGVAVDGALRGRQLTPLVHGNHFWFAAAAFRPDAALRLE